MHNFRQIDKIFQNDIREGATKAQKYMFINVINWVLKIER